MENMQQYKSTNNFSEIKSLAMDFEQLRSKLLATIHSFLITSLVTFNDE